MIQLRGVSKRYRGALESEYALRDVSFSIEAGELAAIIGTSGSGKTTLLNLIGGLDRAYEGSVEVNGAKLEALSDTALSAFRNQEVGFVFQHFSLLDHLSAIENVMLPARFQRGEVKVSREAAEQRARSLLERFGLGGKLDQRPTQLSGGQKQRVAIARALFFEPRLLLCDEPTGSLDQETGRQIIETFQGLNADGLTVLIITHEERVSRAANRIIRVEDGRLVEDSAATTLEKAAQVERGEGEE
ncbi:MAG: ABC transporter ATP-binding protein [Myxococcota bacterium]|nr:ABC transporter ATP-binding protein [Myxococcota bacterium]